jgi:hypothetical protein
MAPSHETHRIAVVDTTRDKITLPGSVGRQAIGAWLNFFALALSVLLTAVAAQAQTVTAAIPGSITSAFALAVDMVRNKV